MNSYFPLFCVALVFGTAFGQFIRLDGSDEDFRFGRRLLRTSSSNPGISFIRQRQISSQPLQIRAVTRPGGGGITFVPGPQTVSVNAVRPTVVRPTVTTVPVAISQPVLGGGLGISFRPANEVSYHNIDRVPSTIFETTAGGGIIAKDGRTNYTYGVNDDLSGDDKSAWEANDVASQRVEGQYTIRDPDDSVRETKYYADETGYHAQVTIYRPDGTTERSVYPPPPEQAESRTRERTFQLVRTQPRFIQIDGRK